MSFLLNMKEFGNSVLQDSVREVSNALHNIFPKILTLRKRSERQTYLEISPFNNPDLSSQWRIISG